MLIIKSKYIKDILMENYRTLLIVHKSISKKKFKILSISKLTLYLPEHHVKVSAYFPPVLNKNLD